MNVVTCLKVSSGWNTLFVFPEIKNKYLRMSTFPSNYRDLGRFAEDGLEFSTASNTAVKMYDALVNMVRQLGLSLSSREMWQFTIDVIVG